MSKLNVSCPIQITCKLPELVSTTSVPGRVSCGAMAPFLEALVCLLSACPPCGGCRLVRCPEASDTEGSEAAAWGSEENRVTLLTFVAGGAASGCFEVIIDELGLLLGRKSGHKPGRASPPQPRVRGLGPEGSKGIHRDPQGQTGVHLQRSSTAHADCHIHTGTFASFSA